jgi:hypothetical protein
MLLPPSGWSALVMTPWLSASSLGVGMLNRAATSCRLSLPCAWEQQQEQCAGRAATREYAWLAQLSQKILSAAAVVTHPASDELKLVSLVTAAGGCWQLQTPFAALTKKTTGFRLLLS